MQTLDNKKVDLRTHYLKRDLHFLLSKDNACIFNQYIFYLASVFPITSN